MKRVRLRNGSAGGQLRESEALTFENGHIGDRTAQYFDREIDSGRTSGLPEISRDHAVHKTTSFVAPRRTASKQISVIALSNGPIWTYQET